MIILDTNVLSELMHPSPSVKVVKWLDQQLSSDLYITAITVAEILYGIARLPSGKKQSLLLSAATEMFDQEFSGRILSFDAAASVVYAELVSRSDRTGRPCSMADAQIAAICAQHDATLVTRNTKDFEMFDLTIINPW